MSQIQLDFEMVCSYHTKFNIIVPALVCNDPEFSNGTISVTWSYIHTGGQPLDSVSVSYTFEEGSTLRNLIFIAINDTQTTSVNLTGIVSAGVRYTFNVTARNNIGTSYVLCAPIFVDIGKFCLYLW